jgi:O-antigen ligase
LIVKDPTFNGRTVIWGEYFDLWIKDPLWGVGNSGIEVALDNAQVSEFATHGHSLIVQSLAVNGLVSLLLLLLLLVCALRIGLSAARRGSWIGLALVVVFVLCNLYEDLTSFGYMGVQVLPLVIGVLLSADSPLRKRAENPKVNFPG